MSEHNKNFYSLKEVERCLEASKEFQDGEEIYYFIGALRYVYDENKQLKDQLQQKENIIKEVREKIDSFDVFKEFTFPLMKRYEEQQVKSSIDYEWRKSIKKPILEILDKEVN